MMLGNRMNFKQWNANYRLAAYLGVLTLLWLASGLAKHNKEEAKAALAEKSASKPAFTVQAEVYEFQIYQHRIKARGQTEANRMVAVMAEVDGKVNSTPAVEGSYVEEGAVLCMLESGDRLLRLEQAKALLEKAELDYQGALKLRDGGYQSKAQIASAKSDLALAEAGLKHRSLEIEKLSIKAPFSGVVEKREVEAGAFLQRGMPCATLVELSPLVVTAQISESDVMSIQPGATTEIRFGNGQTLAGRLRFVSHTSDPVTRTFRIEAELPNKERALKAGLTAEIAVPTLPVKAHLISPSLLALEDTGELGIRVLSDNNIVDNYIVEFVGDDPNGVWVTGLPDRVTLITVGQEYVSRGQKVNVVFNEEAPQLKGVEQERKASLGSISKEITLEENTEVLPKTASVEAE